MRKIIMMAALAVASLCQLHAQTEWTNVLLPKPKQMELSGGYCSIANTVPQVTMVADFADVPRGKDEAYRLEIKDGKVRISAITDLGVLRAKQTLTQIMEGGEQVPCCTILDWPEFPVRAFMQDIGRAYLPVDELKDEINNLSRFKVSIFHWHLAENEAWRLQSDIYPQLNDAQYMTREAGKFYTKAEVREIVDYAAERGMQVVPEIDMPGHSAAFVRAMGFTMESEEGVKAVKALLTEAAETFGDKVKVIHIGTDETPFTNPNFVGEMVAHVRSLGKQAWGWNPGWKFKEGEIDVIHMWSYRGKKTEGVPCIDSKLHYPNHFDTFSDIVALYNSTIYNAQNSDNGVLGTTIAFWHDTPQARPMDIVIQNCFYPSVIAAAERAWMGGGYEYFNDRGTVLYDDDSPQTNGFKDFERRMVWHFEHALAHAPICYVAQCQAKWQITDAFPNEGDLTRVFPPEQGDWKSEFSYNDSTYGTTSVLGSGVYLRHVWGEKMVSALYKNPKPFHTAYAFTKVYSPEDQDAAMLLEFQNYSCSEFRDTIPPQGKWDWRESWIKLNGEPIAPPHWDERPIGQLTNENCAVRPATPIHLNKGWNTILIKLPVGEFTTKQVRLVKWAFTAAITTPDGRHALPGIIYNPEGR